MKYLSLYIIALYVFFASCTPDKLGSVAYGTSNKKVAFSDYMICLVFDGYDYDSYLICSPAYDRYKSGDNDFRTSCGIYPLEKSPYPEVIYEIEAVDSNIVFCHYRHGGCNAIFNILYGNIRTDTGDYGDEVDYQTYLSGYYSYRLSPDCCGKLNDTALSYQEDSLWRGLYEGMLSDYYAARIDDEEHYYTQQSQAGKPSLMDRLHIIGHELKFVIGRSVREANMKTVNSVSEAMTCCQNVDMGKPLIYLPYPLGSSAYIMDKWSLRNFSDDVIYCSGQNFYALRYDLPEGFEKMCNVISYDGNGVLAEVPQWFHGVEYHLSLVPESLAVAKGYISASQALIDRLNSYTGDCCDSLWCMIRQQDTVTHVIPDYGPDVFENVLPLLSNYCSVSYSDAEK